VGCRWGACCWRGVKGLKFDCVNCVEGGGALVVGICVRVHMHEGGEKGECAELTTWCPTVCVP